MYAPPKRKKLTKTERKQIYDLCNGHCAYCGKQMPISEMQVDHVIPLDGWSQKGTDSMDNMLPACRSCNHYKSIASLEIFRKNIERFPEVLMRDNVTYRNAVRFKLVVPDPHPVVFYFEKLGIKVPTLNLKGTEIHGDQADSIQHRYGESHS